MSFWSLLFIIDALIVDIKYCFRKQAKDFLKKLKNSILQKKTKRKSVEKKLRSNYSTLKEHTERNIESLQSDFS